MTSIVIPAHDEESVIGATLSTLLDGLAPGTDVVVVCNGCSDGTAAVAASFGAPVRVVEIDAASKIDALNAGDAAAAGFPRIYLDADIALRGADAGRLAEVLGRPGALIAEPGVSFDLGHSSLVVRAYYTAWVAIHGGGHGDVGGGLYALSEEGRSRFARFPQVVADDTFVRSHFGGHEVVRVEGVETVVRAPRRLSDLLKIISRSRLGVLELDARHPELSADRRNESQSLAGKLRRVPLRVWPLLPVYVAIQVVGRRRGARRMGDLASYRWERDESSRQRTA